MAKETHRPTKSNYQDYLFDFSNVDFSQYAGPEGGQKAEEAPGFLSRLGNTALAIGEGLTMLPGGVVDTVRDAWRGGEIDVTDTEALREREARAREQAAYAQKYTGKAFDGVTDAMISMPYSLATMGASLGAGIPAGMVAGPVVGGAAGMAASGAVAYRASKQDFMENMLAETTRLLGRTPTQEEWDRVAQEFDSEASQYGLWEAGPEALSNLFMARLLGPLGKRLFADGMGKAARRVAGLYGEELATETATQMGQGAIEADLGLRDEAPGFLQALGEVAPATFWQTTLMAGGKKGLDMLARRYGREQVTQEEDDVTEVQTDEQAASATREPMALPGGARLALPEAPIVMGTTDAGLGPIPSPSAEEVNARLWREQAVRRGVTPVPGDPFTDPAAARDTEDFVRRIEEAERLAGEEELLPDRSSPQGGMQLALESGQAVDLLAPPRHTGFLNALGQSALPVERENAGYVTVPAASDMRAVNAAAPAGAENGALPHAGLQGTALPAVSSMPSPLPTQAQLTNIQAMPRADVPAPAEALGMPAPAAVTPEAQPAPQIGDTAVPAVMPAQQPVTPPVVPAPEAATMEAPRQDVSPSMEERAASTQAAHEETAPLMYMGAPISRMPIGDDRRESQADSILQAAEHKAKSAADAQMQAAVADIQRERKHVGVTHDALWDRIHEEIFPYVQDNTQGGGSAQKASSRAELLEQLPREKRAEARRKTTPELREMVRAQTSDPFGPAYTEFSGRPAEAIDYLLQTKGGHVPAAFHKEGLGDIDLPWGKAGKGGYGLAHIIERRNTQGMDGEDFVRRLPSLIANGKAETREGFPGRVYVVSHEGNAEAVISLSYLGADRIWLLTGYEYRKKPSGQQSDDRPVTAFGNEQHIPSLHPDGEKSSKTGRGSRLAQTSTIGNDPADERFLSSSSSGAFEKMVTIPTVEVNEAAAPSGPADDTASGKAAVTLEGKQNTSTPPVAEQRQALLQSLPEALRKANRGAPLKKLKELAEQQEGSGSFSRVVAHVPANAIQRNGDQSAIEVAKAWIREHISSPIQTEIGTVDVDANAIQDSLSHSMYQNKLDAIQAIVPVLEKGAYLGTLPDKDGKPIDNYYFAGKVQIGESEKIVFVRAREAKGMPNRFYVHEVFTQEEIEKSGGIRGVTSDADRPFRNSPDFYRRLLADYLKVKEAGRGETPSAESLPEADNAAYGNTDSQALTSLASRPARRPDSTAVQVVDVDSRIVPEFKRARDLAKWLKAYFEGKREETILSTGKRVRFSNGNLEASIKRGREAAHNQAYSALHDLVRQAEFASFEGKDARHPNLGGQEVYYSALRIGDKLYAVKLKMDVPSEQEIKLRKAWRGESDPEDLRYKDHTLREIEIAPVLYRGVVPKSGVPTQITRAIDTVSLGVLRNAVNPSRIEEGTLASRPARRPDSLPSRFADMPTIEADSTQWFGPGKAIDADSRNMRKAVYDWARTAFPQGTTVDNADTGWRVQVTPSGIKASLHHGYDELLARSVPFIPQIVESGIHLDSIEKKPGLMSHIFANKIRLDGQDYVVGFVLREDDNGNRFYDHELTKIISPDWLKPGHPSSEGPSSEGSSGHRTNRGIPSDWLKPGPALQEGNVVHRTNRGDVMNILRERLGVNDGTGQVLFRTAGQFLPPKFKGRRAPSMEAVRRLADKMNGMAANAARVEIVENAGDLPQNLRDAYASQADSVEGLYDPATDTVWLVAANLESLERAAEVWLHENMVHHGLRSALAPAQRRLLLNQLWQIMGGMGNSSIRDIASRYGRDPRSNEAARLLIMEEALANLAERRAQGMLRSTQEQSLWRRIVDAVVRAWNGMVYTLTGRRGRMGRSQMERLLDALQGHVMEGRPVAMPDAALEEGTDSAGAFASLSADQQEAARAAWMQLQKDMEAWGRQVDAFQPENRPRGRQPKLMTVCSTPDVLQKLGAPALPMTMSADNLAKVLSDKQDHQLPKELVKQLPAALAAPVMVFESATTADSFVVLTELKHEGRSVMAAVHLDTERQRIRVNDIASAYRRGNEAWYLRQMEEGRLLYQDKKKSLAWARTNRLQLPRVRKLPARLSENRILTEEDVVKPADFQPLPSLAEDKKKSLVWARTNRLQLPQVRKLPARLSENRILTEEDVVKPADPGRGGENTPLASLASRPSSLTEGIASGIRTLRKVMGRGVSADVEDILSNREMGNLIPRHDLSLAERLFKLPHWVAKDHAGFARVYDRQLRRVEERSAALKASLEQVPLLFDGDASKRLDQKEQEQLAAMIWKWDGKQIGPIHAIEKFLVTGQTMNGRDELEPNPVYQQKFRDWLKGQPEPERVKQAFLQVREALDTAFLRAYNKMAAMADLADTDLEMYRTEFGSIHNYFPHQRTGKYFVEATIGKGIVGNPRKLVYRQHFDVPLGSSVREEWAKIVAANEKDYPGATWHNPKEVVQLPDDILGAPIDPQAMEQIISAAAARLGNGEQAERVRSTLLSGIADILKARGFGAHGIRRQNIPGFETQDVKGVLYNYMAGLNGWLTKMEAAADFVQALGKIDASASPRLWEYASQYTKDMLRNSDQIDRITGNIKSVAFAWYLGGNIKTAVVNLTQNAVVGVPRLQQYVTGGGARWLKSAMDTIGLSYSGKGMEGARKLTAEEAAMLQELYGNSVITDAYMEEVRGQVSASPTLRMWERFTRLLGWPMSKVEIFNRASLALAAYRAAKAGAFKAHALKTFGLHEGQKMTHEQARDFAAMLVRDTHFEYGRGNQPEFLRSNVAGRMFSPIFTFRSFGANILNLWWRALRYEGKEGRAFVAKSLGATVALGGLTAFPFYATLAALCAAASGDDEDWTSKVRNALPANNLLRDVVCYGLPALAGVNIGGSLRMETPFTEGMKRGETFKEAMTESLGDLLGIPYDLAVNKPSKFLEARRFDADYRAVEALVPTFVANIMQAWRLTTEGQTTMRGRPINSPGQPGARKLSTGEALGKALGFQPTSSAKSYEAYAADKRRTRIRSDRIDDFVNEALRDLESKGRPYMMRELRKALLAWNATMEAEGKPAMRIMPKDVLRRVAARRRENRPSREQKEKGAAQMATWGV